MGLRAICFVATLARAASPCCGLRLAAHPANPSPRPRNSIQQPASRKGVPVMAKVRVAAFSVSLDGYGAGREQSVAAPLGRGGEQLHTWVLPTRTFRAIHG